MATKSITYTATWEGRVIGKRKSPRPYTHAAVVQRDEEAARKHAYEYSPTKTDRSNFDYYSEVARLSVEHPYYGIKSWRPEPDHAGIERCKADIHGGFDAYVSRLREKAIENFLARKKAGGFDPFVAGWSMSLSNAQKLARQHTSGTSTHFLGIVPAIPRPARVAAAELESRTADRVDGYDRDDLGESPDH